jgi:hypothetical protein
MQAKLSCPDPRAGRNAAGPKAAMLARNSCVELLGASVVAVAGRSLTKQLCKAPNQNRPVLGEDRGKVSGAISLVSVSSIWRC